MKAAMQVGCFFLREMGSLLINTSTWMASCVGKWCALWRRVPERRYIYGQLHWATTTSCLIGVSSWPYQLLILTRRYYWSLLLS